MSFRSTDSSRKAEFRASRRSRTFAGGRKNCRRVATLLCVFVSTRLTTWFGSASRVRSRNGGGYGAAHSRGGSVAVTSPVSSPRAETTSGVAHRSSLDPAKRTLNSPAADATAAPANWRVPIAIVTRTGSCSRKPLPTTVTGASAATRTTGGWAAAAARARETARAVAASCATGS